MRLNPSRKQQKAGSQISSLPEAGTLYLPPQTPLGALESAGVLTPLPPPAPSTPSSNSLRALWAVAYRALPSPVPPLAGRVYTGTGSWTFNSQPACPSARPPSRQPACLPAHPLRLPQPRQAGGVTLTLLLTVQTELSELGHLCLCYQPNTCHKHSRPQRYL